LSFFLSLGTFLKLVGSLLHLVKFLLLLRNAPVLLVVCLFDKNFVTLHGFDLFGDMGDLFVQTQGIWVLLLPPKEKKVDSKCLSFL
jgi:hypothetical protein